MQLLRAYLRFVPASRRKLAVLILLSILGALFQAASVGLLLPALEIAEQGNAADQSGIVWTVLGGFFGAFGIPVTLLSTLLGVLIAIFVGQGLIYAHKHMGAAVTEDFIAKMRSHAFGAFVRADLSFHHSLRTGSLTNTLTQDLQRSGGAFDSSLEIMARSVLIVIFVTALFLISWSTALIALAVMLAGGVTVQFLVRVSRRIGVQMVETHQQFHAFASERSENARLLQASNAAERDTDRFRVITRDVGAVRTDHARRAAQVRFVLEPSMAAGGIIAVYAGLTLFDMSLAQVAVFLYVLIRAVPEAYGLNRSRFNVAGFGAHFQHAMELVTQAERETAPATGTRPFVELHDAITLENVTFSYLEAKPVMEDVNLTFEAGRITAIVGPSGAGKSTLLDMLVRLVNPSEGRVIIDGVDAREFELVSLRRGMVLMSQDVLFFNDTVIENIRYGRPEAQPEEVAQAAVDANADAFIRALPDGYDTLLGPRGMTLSGGERQRVALARVLLQHPSVLLLDEATSNLDVESERLIQESILRQAQDRTVIVVAHRMRTIEQAHKVIVLDEGRVAEEGTPAELAMGEGLFRRYLDLQMSS